MDKLFPRNLIGTLAFPVLLLAGCAESVPPPIDRTQVTAVETPTPAYPPELACADIGGRTVLRITVGTEGRPTDVVLVETSGQPALDAAAIEAVNTWRFEPATRAGVAAASQINVPVTFTPPVEKPQSCFVLQDQQRQGATGG